MYLHPLINRTYKVLYTIFTVLIILTVPWKVLQNKHSEVFRIYFLEIALSNPPELGDL